MRHVQFGETMCDIRNSNIVKVEFADNWAPTIAKSIRTLFSSSLEARNPSLEQLTGGWMGWGRDGLFQWGRCEIDQPRITAYPSR